MGYCYTATILVQDNSGYPCSGDDEPSNTFKIIEQWIEKLELAPPAPYFKWQSLDQGIFFFEPTKRWPNYSFYEDGEFIKFINNQSFFQKDIIPDPGATLQIFQHGEDWGSYWEEYRFKFEHSDSKWHPDNPPSIEKIRAEVRRDIKIALGIE